LVVQVVDESVPVSGDGVELEVFLEDLTALVLRNVVDNDYEVVRVVLREDGVEVELDAEVAAVVEAGSDHADGQLFHYPLQPILPAELPVLQGQEGLLVRQQALVDLKVEHAHVQALVLLRIGHHPHSLLPKLIALALLLS
jgi:hypothetical protein